MLTAWASAMLLVSKGVLEVPRSPRVLYSQPPLVEIHLPKPESNIQPGLSGEDVRALYGNCVSGRQEACERYVSPALLLRPRSYLVVALIYLG